METDVPALNIREYSKVETRDIVCPLILQHCLFDPPFNRGGLQGDAREAVEEGWCVLGPSWVVYHEDVAVGVCALRNGSTRTVTIFVNPKYRNQGLGQKLLRKAMESGGSFMGLPTPTSKGLYQKLDIPLFDPTRLI